MPQPLSNFKRLNSLSIGKPGDSALQKRPQLAVLVAEAIATWSNVEFSHLDLFVKLFGGDTANNNLTTFVYLALEGDGPKSAALQAAIDAYPDAKFRVFIRAVLHLAKTAKKARDKLAHHAWGYTTEPGFEDALLLAEPKAVLYALGGTATPQMIDLDTLIYVYREADLRQIIDTNNRLCDYGHKLLKILRNWPENKDDQLYKQLYSQPEIRERVDRLVAQG